MFKISARREIWEIVHNVCSKITDRIPLEMNEKEIIINCIDEAKALIAHLIIDNSVFDRYEVTKSKRIGINLLRLGETLKVFRRAKKDNIYFSLEEKTQRIIFSEEKILLKFNLEHIDQTDSYLELENMTNRFTFTIKIPVEEMDIGIRACGLTGSDEIKMIYDGKTLIMHSDGDFGEAQYEIGINKIQELHFNKKTEGKFLIEMLLDIIQPAMKSKFITLHLGNNLPIRIDFTVLNQKGQVTYYLASLNNLEVVS
jgi:hypothetical protein